MTRFIFVNRFFSPDHSATSQMLSDLAFFLAEQHVDVHVVTSRQLYADPATLLPSNELIHGVTVHRVRTTHFGRARLRGRALDYLSFYFSAGFRLMALLRPGDVVIAKTDPPLISVVAGICAKLRGARHVNWLQDVFPEVAVSLGMKFANGRRGRLLYRIRDWSLRRAGLNVAIGEQMAERVRNRGVAHQTVRVVPNWSDGTAIVPLAHAANPLRTEWGLHERFVVAYSGNMGRAHDLGTLLAAAELLCDVPAICFLLIGDGAQRAALEAEVERRKLGNVIFKPYQPRARLGLSLTVPDVHIVSLQPALEGLIVPSKFYGVAAAGRATLFVGSADGEIGSLLATHGCGASVQIGDAAAMAARLRDWAADPRVCEEAGRKARALFDDRFEMRVAMSQWQGLLTALTGIDNFATKGARAGHRAALDSNGGAGES